MAPSERANSNKHLQLEQMQQSSLKPVQQAKAAAWPLYFVPLCTGAIQTVG